MKIRRIRQRQNGYSLVELIFALLIFQVGVLGVAGMILTAQQSLTRAQLILRGTLEARMTGRSRSINMCRGTP